MNGFRYSKFLFWLCLAHAAYYIITGIWPLVHIESFIWVSGPKYDIWLIKTVGIMILVVGGVILSAGINKRISFEIFLLSIGCAIGLTIIDMYYASIDRIWDVYLLDAAGEILIVIAWLLGWLNAKESE